MSDDTEKEKPYHRGREILLANKHPNFSSENQPENRGRPPGSPNRSTILKHMLGMKVKRNDGSTVPNPFDPENGSMSIEEAIDAKLIEKALKGDLRFIQEVKDTVYGKIKETLQVIPPDVTKKEIADMTDEEAEAAYESALKE